MRVTTVWPVAIPANTDLMSKPYTQPLASGKLDSDRTINSIGAMHYLSCLGNASVFARYPGIFRNV